MSNQEKGYRIKNVISITFCFKFKPFITKNKNTSHNCNVKNNFIISTNEKYDFLQLQQIK